MNVLYKYKQTKDDYHKLCNSQLVGGGDNDKLLVIFILLSVLASIFGFEKIFKLVDNLVFNGNLSKGTSGNV
jgi:hypothetical protein